MTRISLISLWARKRRVAGIAMAVVLGVAFLTGTLVLGDTMSANFDRLFSDVSAGTDVVVRNGTAIDTDEGADDARGPIDESVLDVVRSVDGVAIAEAQVVGYGALVGKDGDAVGGNGPPRLAGSWIADPDLNPYKIAEGRAPEADDEVVVNRGAAEAGDLELGDTTTVLTPAPVEVTIVGIATFGDTDGLGQTTWTAFTLDAAQRHLGVGPPAGAGASDGDGTAADPGAAAGDGTTGRVNTVLASAEPGVSADELRSRVSAALPDGVEAITGDQLADERTDAIASEFLDMMRTFLVLFAVVALVVASLSISNTFAITVAQRTRELALLRAVGASRRQVRRSVTLEALGIGVVAAVVGVGAGLGIAALLKTVFDQFGFALPTGGMKVTPITVVVGLVVGIVVTVVAAQSAARRAGRLAPVAALREGSAESTGVSRRRIAIGAGLTGAGVVGTLLAVAGDAAALVGVAAAVTLVGVLVVAPVALPPVASVLGAGMRRTRGVNGMLATQNARRNPRRSAATATALLVGVAVVSMVTVLASSMKATMADELAGGFGSDLAVTTPAWGGGNLSQDAADEVAELDEVGVAVGLGGGGVQIDGDDTTVTATDAGQLPAVGGVELVDGSLDDLGDDGIAVDESTAEDEGWSVGTDVELTFTDGATQPVTVEAVYADNAVLGGKLIGDDLWVAHTPQPLVRMVLVDVADGVTDAQARQALEPVAERLGGDVADAEEFASAGTEGFDLLLNVVYVLLALAVIIALLGIGNTLALAVHERRRELGLLRAVGQTRRQVRSVLRLESVIVSTFGTLVGLVLGGFLGWALFSTLAASAELGSSFALPTLRLAIVAVLGALAGVLAARRPARRAAKLPVLEAIASE